MSTPLGATAGNQSRDFEEILQYIHDTITPHLRNVLKAVGENRPADPIAFIAKSFIDGSVPSDGGSGAVHEESLAGYLGRYQVVNIVQQAVGACAAIVPPTEEPLKYVGEYLKDGKAQVSSSKGASEPAAEAVNVTDTVWAGGIPLNLVGGESALKSVLNLDANTSVASLFEQFGDVRHSTVRVKPGNNKSWALITFKEIASAEKCIDEGITIMDEGYEEIQLRLSYSDVEGQLQKNPTGALAKMAKKHEADLAPPESDTAWIGGIPNNMAEGELDSVNANFSASCQQFGEVVSVTVRVKPGDNKSWALCTFAKPASAREAVAMGLTVKDGAGNDVTLKVKISDVAQQLQKGTTGALALMAKKHDEEVEAAKELMAKMWSKMDAAPGSGGGAAPGVGRKLQRYKAFDDPTQDPNTA